MADLELEDLRKPWESNEMWKLRRAFLEKYLDDNSMTRNRVLCLSQILVNMEFLGCSYDDTIIDKVKSMADGLLEERQSRWTILERVSTKADADDEDVTAPKKKRRKDDPNGRSDKKTGQTNAAVVVTTSNPICAIKMKILQSLKAELILMQHQRLPNDPLSVLNQACGRAKCGWRIEFSDEKRCCLLKVEDVIVLEQVYWGSQNHSRIEACRRAADILQRPFFDVREKSEKKTSSQRQEIDIELYTRTDARGEWQSPTTDGFEPLEQAFNNLRKRLAAVPQETKKKAPETCLRDAARRSDLDVEMKRNHLGGWKEEIVVAVGKVELCRHQGRIPPKGKEQESADECFLKCIDAVLKLALSDGICVADENGTLTISAKPKVQEKPTAPKAVTRQPSRDNNGNEIAKKELALKSVRLHLNATSEAMNAVQRMEQSCVKAKVKYEVQFDDGPTFTATVFVEGVRIGQATDTSKKGAKNKACTCTIQQLLQPYLKIIQTDCLLTLESSHEPFDR